jgi:hypothetical protein
MPHNVPIPLERPYSLGEEQAILGSQPGSGVHQIARASAADRSNKSASMNASTTPVRPAVSAYAPALSETQNGDLPPPFLIPATNVRSFY